MRSSSCICRKSGTRFTSCGRTQIFVIPRRAARRGISLFLRSSQREIPRFARNDKMIYFCAACLVCLLLNFAEVAEVKSDRLKPVLLEPLRWGKAHGLVGTLHPQLHFAISR